MVSSHDPTNDTATVPTTKTSRALNPARRAVRAVNCRRAMTATTSSATATTSPTASSTSRSSPASDTTRPIVGRHQEQHDEGPPRRPQPPPQADAEREEHGGVHEVGHDRHRRDRHGVVAAVEEPVQGRHQPGDEDDRRQHEGEGRQPVRPPVVAQVEAPGRPRAVLRVMAGRTRLVGDRRHLSSSRGPVLKDSQAVRLFRRGTHLAARTRPSTAAASLPARKGPSP